MRQYLDALEQIMTTGIDTPNRTGIDTRTVAGITMRFDLSSSFPAITTKKLAFRAVTAELLWIISGSSDVHDLQALGCHIWDANADASYWKPKARFDGDLGRVYGVQWRDWKTADGKSIDQLTELVENIRAVKDDSALSVNRRLILMAWNPGELDQMALPPCHMFAQFHVLGNKLSCQMYQRSCDMFLGVPFNIASYSLLTILLAKVTGLEPGEFIHNLGNAHIYHNHFDQVAEQLSREPYTLPTLLLQKDTRDITAFSPDDIRLVNYQSHPAIKAEMAV